MDVAEEKRIVTRVMELEEANQDNPNYLGPQWHDIPASATAINSLVSRGRLRISFQSRRFTHVRSVSLLPGADEDLVPAPAAEWPQDLFSVVVGHQDVLNLANLALAAPRPVHLLLWGPPGTAKSLILDEVARLPASFMCLGATTSRAGLAHLLVTYRPRYLVVDEVDKADRQDLSILLRLMESHQVIYTKRGFTVTEDMDTWVFAGANVTNHLPRELLDRFAVCHVGAYGADEYRSVVFRVLRDREGCEEEMATYIAGRLVHGKRSVREAVRVARMAGSIAEVDKVLQLLSSQEMGN